MSPDLEAPVPALDPASPVFHVKHRPTSASTSFAAPRMRRPRHWPVLLALLVLLATLGTACSRVAAPEGWAAPVGDGSQFYAQLDRGVLWAFQLNGTAVQRGWRYPPADSKLKFDAVYATPVLQGSVLYLVTHTGDVAALDAGTGQPLAAWGGAPVVLKQNVVATPVFDGKHLVVATENGDIYSFDAATGQHTRILHGSGRIWSGLALQGDIVYVANLDTHEVSAVSIATGAVAWTQDVGPALANLAIDGNLLLAGSLNRGLHALDITAGGKEQWTFTGDGWFAAEPAVGGDAVYDATLKGTVYGINATTGAELWHFHQEGESFRSQPVLVGDTLVIVSRDGMIYGLHAADGTEAWHHALTNQHVDADPMVSGTDVLIITNSGQLVRVAAATGDVQTPGASS
jgi:outer membrane protein assembly factor BamB